MSPPTPLPHELGQNLLVDPAVVAEIVDHARRALRPGDRMVEIGAGDGALTQRLVEAVFTGRGRGVPDVLARTGSVSRRRSAVLARELGLGPRTPPRDLDADQWTRPFRAGRELGPR